MSNLIYEEKPKIDTWLKVLYIAIIALPIILGIIRILDSTEEGLVSFGAALFVFILFRLLLPQRFQVFNDKLKIKPFYKKQIQPATYDLRLGNRILASPLGPEKLGEVVDLSPKRPNYDIQSGQMVAIISLEKLELPLDLCGRFGIRSAYARLGINAFGGLQLDPGFRGKLIMNLLNVGPEPITVTLKEPIFSVEFERLEEPSEVPYSGPYQEPVLV